VDVLEKTAIVLALMLWKISAGWNKNAELDLESTSVLVEDGI